MRTERGGRTGGEGGSQGRSERQASEYSKMVQRSVVQVPEISLASQVPAGSGAPEEVGYRVPNRKESHAEHARLQGSLSALGFHSK